MKLAHANSFQQYTSKGKSALNKFCFLTNFEYMCQYKKSPLSGFLWEMADIQERT